jgi:hypothetical protein
MKLLADNSPDFSPALKFMMLLGSCHNGASAGLFQVRYRIDTMIMMSGKLMRKVFQANLRRPVTSEDWKLNKKYANGRISIVSLFNPPIMKVPISRTVFLSRIAHKPIRKVNSRRGELSWRWFIYVNGMTAERMTTPEIDPEIPNHALK